MFDLKFRFSDKSTLEPDGDVWKPEMCNKPDSVITVRTCPQEHGVKKIGPSNGYIGLYRAIYAPLKGYIGYI